MTLTSKQRKALIKEYLDKASFTSIDEAEKRGHQHLVSLVDIDLKLDTIEKFPKYSGRLQDVKGLMDKFNINLDLCRQEYDMFIEKLSESSRQALAKLSTIE